MGDHWDPAGDHRGRDPLCPGGLAHRPLRGLLGVLDIEWALSGYDDGEVYLSVFSGWDPAQYYFNAVVDTDGHHT